MLVLSRHVGESVVLPDCRTTIKILRVSGNRVRVGIDAPVELAVHRAETWRRMSERIAAVADLPPRVRGRIEVLWLDDGGGETRECLSVPLPDRGVSITAVGTVRACVKQLIRWRPDLLLIDLDAVDGQPQSVLQFVRRHKDLSLVPVILIGNRSPRYGQNECGATIVDRWNKPVDADLIAEGVTALFAYSNWRKALPNEEWHREGQVRGSDNGNGARNDEPCLEAISPEQHWHSRRKSSVRRRAPHH